MDFSDITSIICEFNPFHHGHKYLLQKAKEKYGTVVCIMSGNFVQRGETAFTDKYARAEAAVRCGADLVLSLPFPHCVMSARDFAYAGVHIVSMLGIRSLTFGAESEKGTLFKLADTVSSDDFEEYIKAGVKNEPNASYAVLRQKYAEKSLGRQAADELTKPNNILALEYIAATRKNGFDITPNVIKRDESFLSSSEIRKKPDFINYLPRESADVLKSAPLLNKAAFSSFAIASLRQKEAREEYYEAFGGLDGRILKAAQTCDTLDELYQTCTSSSFTRSKCRRAVISMIFGISKGTKKAPGYTQLLCADKRGMEFLAYCRKNVGFPIITKPSSALGTAIENAFLKEAIAENAAGVFYDKPLPHPLKRTPVII